MSFRTTLFIILVFVGIAGAYLLFFQSPTEEIGGKDKPRIYQVYDLPPQKIKRVRLTFADEAYQPLTLVKDADGSWKITEPFQAHADSAKVSEMLADFVNKRVRQTLQVAELEQYGLETPNITVELYTDMNNSSKTFLLGKKGINFSVYTKAESEAHIFLIESSALDDLTKSPTDLRDRAVIKFNLNTVSKIQFQLSEKIACKKERGIWKMTYPLSVSADSPEIGNILAELHSLQVSTFEADSTDLKKYGLDTPRIRFTLTDNMGTQELAIGAAVPSPPGQENSDTRHVYVKPVHQGGIYTVRNDIYTLLNKSVFALRDKRVLDFQRGDTIRFEIQRGTEKIVGTKIETAVRNAERWELQTPIKIKADAQAVSDLIYGVDSLEAVAFVSDSTENLAQYGLETPSMQVAFTLHGKKTPAVLHIGNYRQDDTVYVKAGNSARVVRVKRDLIDKIAMGLAWLRDRQILKFNIDDAIRLTLAVQGDVPLTCKRLSTNWRLTAPVKEDANNAEVNAIIYELNDLKAEAFVSGEKHDLSAATTGFNTPVLQITVELRNQKVYTLQIGKTDASGRFYSRLRHLPKLIFLLDAELIPKLKTTREQLRAMAK